MADSSAWLRHSAGDSHSQPAVRLLCLPHAGGGASSFNGWRRVLPAWVELVRVQLPGREDRRECSLLTRIEDLIPLLFPHVRALQDRPIALYGHSMGALVAFELTRELRRKGLATPLVVMISGRRAPHRPLRRSHEMHNLPDQELVDRLMTLGGIPPGMLNNSRWRDHYLPIIRADLCLSDVYSYRSEPGLACPLHTFLGKNDNLVVREDWEAWSDMAEGEFSRQLLPGGHFFDKPAQAELIARLTKVITNLLGRVDSAESARVMEHQ